MLVETLFAVLKIVDSATFLRHRGAWRGGIDEGEQGFL